MEDLHVGEVIFWLSSFFSKFQHENVIKTSLFSPHKLPRIQYQLSRTIHRAAFMYVVSSNIGLKQWMLIFFRRCFCMFCTCIMCATNSICFGVRLYLYAQHIFKFPHQPGWGCSVAAEGNQKSGTLVYFYHDFLDSPEYKSLKSVNNITTKWYPATRE